MRNFRLIVKPNVVILERRLLNGICVSTELNPDKREQDAKLLDQLMTNLVKA